MGERFWIRIPSQGLVNCITLHCRRTVSVIAKAFGMGLTYLIYAMERYETKPRGQARVYTFSLQLSSFIHLELIFAYLNTVSFGNLVFE